MSRHVHGQNRRILIPSHIRPRHQHLAWPQQYSCQEDTSQAQRPERPAAARHFGAQPRCLEGNEAMVHDLHVIVFKTTANNGNICNIKFCSNSGFFLFRREFGCGLPFWTQLGWLFDLEPFISGPTASGAFSDFLLPALLRW